MVQTVWPTLPYTVAGAQVSPLLTPLSHLPCLNHCCAVHRRRRPLVATAFRSRSPRATCRSGQSPTQPSATCGNANRPPATPFRRINSDCLIAVVAFPPRVISSTKTCVNRRLHPPLDVPSTAGRRCVTGLAWFGQNATTTSPSQWAPPALLFLPCFDCETHSSPSLGAAMPATKRWWASLPSLSTATEIQSAALSSPHLIHEIHPPWVCPSASPISPRCSGH
jgi:hypothetical protein